MTLSLFPLLFTLPFNGESFEISTFQLQPARSDETHSPCAVPQLIEIWRLSYFENFDRSSWRKAFSPYQSRWSVHFFSLRINVSEYTRKDGRHVPLHSGIRFSDSFQFMSQSLDNLANTMETSSVHLLPKHFLTWLILILEKIRGKGFFPYNYSDSSEKLPQTSTVYADAWRNSLSGIIDINVRGSEKAEEIYTLMRSNSFCDYHDFFLLSMYIF